MRGILLVLVIVLASTMTFAPSAAASQAGGEIRLAALTTGEEVPLPPARAGRRGEKSGPADGEPATAGEAALTALPVPLPLPRPEAPQLSDEEICRLVEAAANDHEIPVRFFTRLIWKESSFRVGAVSRAGARGIAQFMPVTAKERGLEDPLDPEEALPASASLLQELRRRFGNLGLAAAAYNAGARRVWNWLDKRGPLPEETRDYVETITGQPASHWAKLSRRAAMEARKRQVRQDRCIDVAAALRNPVTAMLIEEPPLPPAKPQPGADWAQTASL